jgi:hypothetical protein
MPRERQRVRRPVLRGVPQVRCAALQLVEALATLAQSSHGGGVLGPVAALLAEALALRDVGPGAGEAVAAAHRALRERAQAAGWLAA